MSKIYDLSTRLGTSRPCIRLADGVEFNVNNSMAAAVAIRHLQKELDGGKGDEFEAIKKMITIALGAEAVEYLENQDASITDWMKVTEAVSYALTEEDLPSLSAEKDGKKESGKK